MSTQSKIDPSTLGWVKHEIDETLKQARLALESFIETPADKTRLRFCLTHLHQVVGTLLMVELDGAALLARETEQLAEALLNDEAPASQENLDVLSRGILLLPDYLARLQAGAADMPIRHLGLLNEMHAARRVPAIAAHDLFQPDLAVRPPVTPEVEKLPPPEYPAAARQLRPGYQQALLTWLRDPAQHEALARIADIFDELKAKSSVGAHAQLFWVAAGLAEALAEGLEPSVDRKKYFARLDQHIRHIIDGAEKAVLRKGAEDLVRGLLYEVGQAGSHGARVTQLKQAFALDSLLATGDTAAAAVAEMPSPEVLAQVATVLGKEIEIAQDLLSTYFDPQQPDTSALARLAEQLRKMGGTLEMLGVPNLKALVDTLTDATRAIEAGQLADPVTASMPMAQGLVLLENSTREIRLPAVEWHAQIEQAIQRLRAATGIAAPLAEGIEVKDAELTEQEFRQLAGAVGHEVGVNLGRIEEALEGFASNTSKKDLLDEVPGLLSQIQGALQILGQEPAAQLADAVRAHVEDIQSGALVPGSGVLDALAVSIGTIGAFLDGLRTGRRNLEGLIEAAQGEMQAALAGAETHHATPQALVPRIRAHLDNWLQQPDDAGVLAQLQRALAQLNASAAANQLERISRISGEMDNLLSLVARGEATLSDEVSKMLTQSSEALHALVARAPEPEPAPAPSAPAAKPAVSEPADPEIMGIFIEDARDVLMTIAREFIVWREDRDNHHALQELRRGYHTIKGSGRMVGAGRIAEFAWSIENMLNKLRDGKVPFAPRMLDILEQGQAAIPQLVDELESGSPVTIDVEALRQQAWTLAGGSAPTTAPTPAPSVSASAAPSVTLPRLDGTLLEIFTGEAAGHLQTLRQEIESCRAAGSACMVEQPLFRAVHTLGGNARSLGLDMLAHACAEVEKVLQAHRTQSLPLSAWHVDLLGRFEQAVSELIEALNDRADADTLPARFAAIQHEAHDENLQLVESAAHTHPEAGLTAVSVAPVMAPPPVVVPVVPAAPTPRPAKPVVEADDTVSEKLDPELVDIFQEEAVDIMGVVDESLTRWRAAPDDTTMVAELKRALHTLKGGARMAGAMTMGMVAHNTESLLKNVEDGKLDAQPALFDLLDEVNDTLIAMLDRVRAGQPVPTGRSLNARLLALIGGTPLAGAPPAAAFEEELVIEAPDVAGFEPVADFDLAPPAALEPVATPAPAFATGVELEPRLDATEETAPWPQQMERRGQIRVNTSLLNNLVNFAGEVSIARARMEQQIYGFRDNLGELQRNVTRFRDQLRELEIQSESQILYRVESRGEGKADFDPLEFDRFSRLQQLSRQLSESLHDLTTIQGNLGTFAGVAETVLQQQARLNTELQEGLMRTRMVSFATQGARLRTIVRQTARELGKRVELDLIGAEVELDRTVLERMIGPFEHMIRNAIDHGLEPEAVRRKAGKPEEGKITIATAQEGSEIVVRFSDDGAGLDIAAIRAKAIERGLLKASDALTDDELIQFILLPGFSTARQITELSGRGVGMDVVHTEVKQLGGSMAVETHRGQGTSFTIRLPLTLSIMQALMIFVGDQHYAVPLASVANIIEFPVDRLNELAVGHNPLLNWNEHVYPYMHLAARLGIDTPAGRSGRKVPVLLARTGTREVAIQVDALGGTREIVVKALGPQLAEMKGLAGATILGDGRVVLILDVPGLWLREDQIYVEHRPEPEAVAAPVREHPVVMVVDDSLTVRKVTSKHLQKRGYEIMVAKDGVDAVEQLREKIPDLMLVDIEMPRMDGYELTTRVRGDRELKHIPIIMITSRAGAKHRQKAFDLGVDVYMSKPYQEDDLFQNIQTLLASGRAQ